jgi:hypothetical protein
MFTSVLHASAAVCLQLYNSLFIRGRNLRMVHLPSGLDAGKVLDKHIDQVKKQRVAAALAVINTRHTRQAKGIDAEAASNTASAATAAGRGDSGE